MLLIKTKDKQLVAYQKHFKALLPFAKTFNAEIFLIKTIAEPLDLSSIAKAICDSGSNKIDFEVIAKVFPKRKKGRSVIIEDAVKVRKHIKTKFLTEKSISLKDLKKIFMEMDLTTSCLCKHLTQVRKELEKEGYQFKRVGHGVYQMH